MSDTSQQDWRAEALRRMEQADQQPIPERRRQDNWAAVVAIKLTALVLLSVGLVWFLGYGWLFATVLVGWYLFWPR